MVDLVAGPTTGGVILAFETARQLGVRSIFAEEVTAADGTTRSRVPARLPDRAGRAGPPRRRHPHDRRVAAGDAAGRGGDGRRHRRMSRARRSERRSRDADVAGRPGARIRCDRSGGWTCRPTSPGPRPARAARTGTPLYAPGSSGTPAGRRTGRRLTDGPADAQRLRSALFVLVIGVAAGGARSCSGRSACRPTGRDQSVEGVDRVGSTPPA